MSILSLGVLPVFRLGLLQTTCIDFSIFISLGLLQTTYMDFSIFISLVLLQTTSVLSLGLFVSVCVCVCHCEFGHLGVWGELASNKDLQLTVPVQGWASGVLLLRVCMFVSLWGIGL